MFLGHLRLCHSLIFLFLGLLRNVHVRTCFFFFFLYTRVPFHGFVFKSSLSFLAVSVASVHISSHVVFNDGDCFSSWATFSSSNLISVVSCLIVSPKYRISMDTRWSDTSCRASLHSCSICGFVR